MEQFCAQVSYIYIYIYIYVLVVLLIVVVNVLMTFPILDFL